MGKVQKGPEGCREAVPGNPKIQTPSRKPGFRVLGFRVYGFRVYGFRVLGLGP